MWPSLLVWRNWLTVLVDPEVFSKKVDIDSHKRPTAKRGSNNGWQAFVCCQFLVLHHPSRTWKKFLRFVEGNMRLCFDSKVDQFTLQDRKCLAKHSLGKIWIWRHQSVAHSLFALAPQFYWITFLNSGKFFMNCCEYLAVAFRPFIFNPPCNEKFWRHALKLWRISLTFQRYTESQIE